MGIAEAGVFPGYELCPPLPLLFFVIVIFDGVTTII